MTFRTLQITYRISLRKVQRYWMNHPTAVSCCIILVILLLWWYITASKHGDKRCSSSLSEKELPLLSNLLDYNSKNRILEQFGWTAKRPTERVILLTYMRSGSSFTGSIIGSHPEVVYFFEPLHSLHKYKPNSRRSRPSMFIMENARDISDMGSSEEMTQQILESYLNCDFLKLDLKSLQDRFPFLHSQTTPFTVCVRTNPGMMGVIQCLSTLYKQCTASNATAIKTIRTSMYTMKRLLKQDKNIKVIYLLRDPRAVTLSQLQLKRAHSPQVAYNRTSKKLCFTVWTDLMIATKLMKKYPDRIVGLMYEDLVRDPYNIAKKIFQFMGLEHRDEVSKFIKSLTFGTKDGKCVTCVSRKNSTQTSLQWRLDIDYKGALLVENNCKMVNRMAGYIPLESEKQLRNLNIPVRVRPRIPVLV